MCITVFLIAVL
jgi:hypothetical protein